MLLEELRWASGDAPLTLHHYALHPWEAQALLPRFMEVGFMLTTCQLALLRSAPGAAGVCTAAGARLQLIGKLASCVCLVMLHSGQSACCHSSQTNPLLPLPPPPPPRWLETQAHPEGPFLLGKELSLADAALLPFLLRLPILQHYRGLALPQECARLARCIQAGKEAPAVKVRPAAMAAAMPAAPDDACQRSACSAESPILMLHSIISYQCPPHHPGCVSAHHVIGRALVQCCRDAAS